jgi:hypothetical protein
VTEAESIEATKQGFEFLCRQAALIAMLPLEEWQQGFDRADTITPILDPTLYSTALASKKTEAIKEIIAASLPLKRVVEKWQSAIKEGLVQ